MVRDTDWFRHRGRWPLTRRWSDDANGNDKPIGTKQREIDAAWRHVDANAGENKMVTTMVATPVDEKRPSVGTDRDAPLLTTEEAARVVRLSVRTLERFRVSGEGARFLKAGPGKRAKVLYRAADLMAWLEQFAYASTSEYASREDGR